MEEFESVIGLEIHVQLNTKTKLFSFAPNTNISEICTGQPGSLPILNKEAIYKAALFGLAIEGKVENYFYFDRKSYFYPDSPRNFQITQYERPIIQGGKIPISEDRFIEISHAHLEDDSGMLKHFSKFSGVDYNRAGVPLLEIVSKPNIFSPQDAKAYAMSIKSIMQYIGASDCNMDKGHLRIDANVSVRKKGEKTLRNKTEIKNMNSFNFLEMALEKEIQRQIEIYKKNEGKNKKSY